MNPSHDIFPSLPERISGIADLSFNLWWSWNPTARMLFKRLNRTGWKLSGHNPVAMLHGCGKENLDRAAADPHFIKHYDAVLARFGDYMKPAIPLLAEPEAPAQDLSITLFSAEYGLHHSLPFYAGGLGFLAGDILKEFSDLGIRAVGVGFMYPKGYFRQRFNGDGWQMDIDEPVQRERAPILKMLDEKGDPLQITVPLIRPEVKVEVWKVQVGKVSLYLLDTDVETNDPWNRKITSHLYGGSVEQRLRQEIVLGIGGVEVLRHLGVGCSVLHLNEGHTGFAVLERIRQRVEKGVSYPEAFDYVRRTTVFTTHTPVPAGHDVFPFEMIERYFASYRSGIGLDREAFFQLGVDPADPGRGFNMTAFSLKASARHNGVSRRHGEIARKMWQSLWPDLPESEVPIGHITNGIHVPTWINPRMELLLDRYLGPDWLTRHDNPEVWQLVDEIPDEELWEAHLWLKEKLIQRIRERARGRWIDENPHAKNILGSGVLLDPNVLTLGFARRFATYKRADLLFRDTQKLKEILMNRWQPVQIIFAGKAHPADDPAKKILQQVFLSAQDPALGGRVAFIEDYDEQLAQYMVHGVDVWLNNPLPPYEASGTSGMKASINGVPSLSILDGWWIEGFNGKNGWAFGDRETAPDRDAADSLAIYRILEEEVVPVFYQRDEQDIPRQWLAVMKEAIKSIGPHFCSRRMVKEYVSLYYQESMACAKNSD